MFCRSVPGFVNSLVPYLKPQIFSPGDVIVKEVSCVTTIYISPHISEPKTSPSYRETLVMKCILLVEDQCKSLSKAL